MSIQGSIYEQETTVCNCSICQRNGYLFIYPKDTDVTWHSGREMLKSYAFASNSVGHRFCPECGTSICAKSDVPGFLEGFMALNVRSFEGVDIDKLNLKQADGRSIRDIRDIPYAQDAET